LFEVVRVKKMFAQRKYGTVATATKRRRRKIVNKCTVRRVVEGREQRVVSDERMREGMKTFAI